MNIPWPTDPRMSFAPRPRRQSLHNTFTLPSSFSCPYEGDKTAVRNHSTPSRRHLTFGTDSEEEFSDPSPLAVSPKTVNMPRTRQLVCKLSPPTSKIILKSVIYQILVELATTIIFLLALLSLSAFQLFKQVLVYLYERRGLLCDWIGKWAPYSSLVAAGLCGFYYIYYQS